MEGHSGDGQSNRFGDTTRNSGSPLPFANLTAADLKSTDLDPLPGGRCLTFFWSMHGSAVNKLEVLMEFIGSTEFSDYIIV